MTGAGRSLALSDCLRLIAPRATWMLLAVLGAGSCKRASHEVVRIGVAGSFSDPTGLPMKQAAELAAEEINAAGGINGRRLELVTRDDYADPDSAVFIAGDLYASGVSAVVGHLFSGMTLAASPLYNGGSNPVVAVSPSSSSPELTIAGDYTFRVCPSDLAQGAALAHWVHARLRLDRGALLYLNDQYGRGIRQSFVEEYQRLGGVLQSIDPYLGDHPEVGPYLDRLARRERPQFLIVAGNRGEAEEIIRQARRRGLDMPVLGGDGLAGIEEAGALAEGVYLSSPYFPNIPTEANKRFVEAFRRRFPNGGMPNQPAAGTYDAIYLLREVIARAGTGREAIRNALAGVGRTTPPFEGVSGTVAFDAAGDLSSPNLYIGLVRKGAVEVQGSEEKLGAR
jgi:branched-chain amino acid transport system substrate-binding protein